MRLEIIYEHSAVSGVGHWKRMEVLQSAALSCKEIVLCRLTKSSEFKHQSREVVDAYILDFATVSGFENFVSETNIELYFTVEYYGKILNPILNFNVFDVANSAPYQSFPSITGVEYCFIRRSFLPFRDRSKTKGTAILLGGTATAEVIREAVRVTSSLLETPIVAYGTQSIDLSLLPEGISYERNPDNIESKIASHTISLVAPGVSCFESLYLGNLVILYPLNAGHEVVAKEIMENKAGWAIYDKEYQKLNVSDYTKQEVKEFAMGLVDGKGAHRIMKHILQIWKT